MIHSMTAFARTQGQGHWGTAVCEIRSINHRYLELIVRMPDNLHELEAPIRECIRDHLKRGKIECHIRYQPGDVSGTSLTINTHFAKELIRAHQNIADLLTNIAPINMTDILRWPGILQIAEVDLEVIQDQMIQLVTEALKKLIDARVREGEEIKQLFFQRLDQMKVEVANIRKHLPTILIEQRERLVSRFRDAKIELDSNRFEQEIVFFAQKMDVSEELDRIDTHISEVRRVLKQGGVTGRRLDFLMQELHREANTLGAKSVDVNTTRASVELKVLIEQMREQVQNVE